MSGGIIPDVPIPVDVAWVKSNYGRLIEIQWEAYKREHFFGSQKSFTPKELRLARRAFFAAIAGSLYFQACLNVSEVKGEDVNAALQSMLEEAVKTLSTSP